MLSFPSFRMAISEAYSVPADKRPDLPDAGFSNFPFHCKLKENMAMPERAACLQRDHALWKTLQQGRDEAVTQCGNVMKDTPWSCPSNRNTSRIFGRAVLRGNDFNLIHSLAAKLIKYVTLWHEMRVSFAGLVPVMFLLVSSCLSQIWRRYSYPHSAHAWHCVEIVGIRSSSFKAKYSSAQSLYRRVFVSTN